MPVFSSVVKAIFCKIEKSRNTKADFSPTENLVLQNEFLARVDGVSATATSAGLRSRVQ